MEKTIFTLNKIIISCELPNVTCQRTGRCVRRERKPCDMKGESLKNYPRCQFQNERFLMNAGCGPLMSAYRFPVEINHLCKVIAKYVDITQLIKKTCLYTCTTVHAIPD